MFKSKRVDWFREGDGGDTPAQQPDGRNLGHHAHRLLGGALAPAVSQLGFLKREERVAKKMNVTIDSRSIDLVPSGLMQLEHFLQFSHIEITRCIHQRMHR